MGYNTILFERDGSIAKVTLNRPTAFNALNMEMGAELQEAFTACHSDHSIRAVILTGAGNAFCSGGDVKAMTEHLDADPALFLRNLAAYLHNMISAISRMPKPVISAVNGVAAGAGFSIAVACDLTLASAKARFNIAYTGIGLTPDGGATAFLPRLIGAKRTLELIYTNKVLNAEQAMQLGMVSEVVPEDQLAARADELAKKLAGGPTAAFGRAKQLVYSGLVASLETQMENERQGIAESSLTADFREGAMAFKEKRPAKFVGR